MNQTQSQENINKYINMYAHKKGKTNDIVLTLLFMADTGKE